MRTPLYLLALGGTLVGPVAEASVLSYFSDGDARVAWTDADCTALNPDPILKAACYPTLDRVPEKLRGPTGRVLLAKDGLTHFEADADTGEVIAVITDGKGGIVAVTRLVVPLVSTGGKNPARRLVTARIESMQAETGLISPKLAGVKRVVTLTIVTFPPDGSDFEEAELSFDLETLDPTVSPSALRTLSVGGGSTRTSTYTYWLPEPPEFD